MQKNSIFDYIITPKYHLLDVSYISETISEVITSCKNGKCTSKTTEVEGMF